MIFRPFYRFETGCAAYVFGCGGQGVCCVVDPHESDIDAYIKFAADKAMRIAYVFETHVHADHRSGGRALVVSDLRRGPEPWFACTGDTLFVGAVGRPDLPGHERENAATLHHSVRDKLLVLPDALEIYPAHFAGSPCGAGISGKPTSTIAFEKRWNALLGLGEAAFVDALGGTAPAKPAEMDAIMRFNQGRGV